MATVFVLTAGWYSDHRVVGIFSTREAAEAVAASNPNETDIEEYPVDGLIEHSWGFTWNTRINLETGTIDPPFRWSEFRHPSAGVVEAEADGIRVQSPISAEHAVKLAIEARQEWLRTRAIPAANTA